MNQGSIVKAALLGGLLAGVVSSIPFLSMLCCVWALGGGAFAAWVLISDSGGAAGAARCAAGGFAAGLVGGTICAPLQGLINRLVLGPDGLEEQAEQAGSLVGGGGEIPPEMMEAILRGTTFTEFNVWSLFIILLMAALFSLLGLFGGLIGSGLFGRKQASAAHGMPAQPQVPPVEPYAPPGGSAPLPPADEPVGELSPDELPELPPADAPPEDDDERRS